MVSSFDSGALAFFFEMRGFFSIGVSLVFASAIPRPVRIVKNQLIRK